MNVMRTTVATVVAATLSMSAFSAFAAASLTGAGATFPAPVYAKWADTYQKETGNKVNYQGIGSSGGVKQIIANTVDFGASDAPLADDKLTQEGLFQFPTVIGGVVLAVNLPGVKSGELVLDGKTLGDIYLGKIKKWDDEAIAKLNPGLKLPSQNIAVVRRADGSGTSFVFTSYLSKVNEEWKSKIGAGSTVNWPTGLGGKGNVWAVKATMVSPPLFSVCRARLVTSNTLTLSKTTWPTPNWSLPTASRLARLKTTSLTPQKALTGASLSLRT